MELWLLYVSTPQRGMHPVFSKSSPISSIHGSDHKLGPNLQKGLISKKGFVHVPVMVTTKRGTSPEGVVNLQTDVPYVLETTLLQTVTAGKYVQLYSLG